MCVCVCVCVFERESVCVCVRERERAGGTEAGVSEGGGQRQKHSERRHLY